MLGNRMGKAVNGLMQLGRQRLSREALKGRDQRMREAVRAVTVLDDVFVLHVIQDRPHLLARVFAMIQKGDELRDRALEIDVVLPKRVVSVYQQRLRRY